jgi:hypothetical protein
MLAENWNGQQWSSVALPTVTGTAAGTNLRLTGVSGDSANDVIAVGNALGVQPLAFRWNGNAWQALPVPSGAWWSSMAHVKTFSPTSASAIGETATATGYTATATHWNGTSLTQVATPFRTSLVLTMNAISGSSPTDIWAAGIAESQGSCLLTARQLGTGTYHLVARYSASAPYLQSTSAPRTLVVKK